MRAMTTLALAALTLASPAAAEWIDLPTQTGGGSPFDQPLERGFNYLRLYPRAVRAWVNDGQVRKVRVHWDARFERYQSAGFLDPTRLEQKVHAWVRYRQAGAPGGPAASPQVTRWSEPFGRGQPIYAEDPDLRDVDPEETSGRDRSWDLEIPGGLSGGPGYDFELQVGAVLYTEVPGGGMVGDVDRSPENSFSTPVLSVSSLVREEETDASQAGRTPTYQLANVGVSRLGPGMLRPRALVRNLSTFPSGVAPVVTFELLYANRVVRTQGPVPYMGGQVPGGGQAEVLGGSIDLAGLGPLDRSYDLRVRLADPGGTFEVAGEAEQTRQVDAQPTPESALPVVSLTGVAERARFERDPDTGEVRLLAFFDDAEVDRDDIVKYHRMARITAVRDAAGDAVDLPAEVEAPGLVYAPEGFSTAYDWRTTPRVLASGLTEEVCDWTFELLFHASAEAFGAGQLIELSNTAAVTEQLTFGLREVCAGRVD